MQARFGARGRDRELHTCERERELRGTRAFGHIIPAARGIHSRRRRRRRPSLSLPRSLSLALPLFSASATRASNARRSRLNIGTRVLPAYLSRSRGGVSGQCGGISVHADFQLFSIPRPSAMSIQRRSALLVTCRQRPLLVLRWSGSQQQRRRRRRPAILVISHRTEIFVFSPARAPHSAPAGFPRSRNFTRADVPRRARVCARAPARPPSHLPAFSRSRSASRNFRKSSLARRSQRRRAAQRRVPLSRRT